MIPLQKNTALLALACLGACAQPDAALAKDKGSDPTADACTALVMAEPKDWAQRLPAVLHLGRDAAATLTTALRRNPDGPGAQAAVAALGRLGGDAAHACLLEQLHGPSDLATEAALALGECAQPDDRPTLLAIANDRLADATLRAACVSTLLQAGTRAGLRDLVRALVLADTPMGLELQQRVGLPQKSRWAYERYLLSRTLRRVAGESLGFDTDASWPTLRAVAERIDAWLEANS